ncbi:MAG: cytoplasmic protein [Anaerolineae bacterium]|nr:cytoplasmic protein [Anaerolineae bacterium]
MSEKVAIFLLAGPEMPCRMIHTFIWALDIVEQGGEAKIVLEGEAPRWLLVLPDPEHGRHKLYQRVKELGLIDAVCKACAIQAQALDAAAEEGLPIVYDASGHVSLAAYVERGYHVVML